MGLGSNRRYVKFWKLCLKYSVVLCSYPSFHSGNEEMDQSMLWKLEHYQQKIISFSKGSFDRFKFCHARQRSTQIVFSSCQNGLCVQKSLREQQFSKSFLYFNSSFLKCLYSLGFLSKLQKLDLGFDFWHLFTCLFSRCPQWHFSLSRLRNADNRAGDSYNCKAKEEVHG